MARQTTYIPLSHMQAVLYELDKLGYSKTSIFEGAGVSINNCEDAQSRLPVMEFTRLYAHAFRLLEAQTSLRPDREPIRKGVVDMMCYCAINSKNLREAIDRTTVFTSIINTQGASLELTQTSVRAQLAIDMHRRNQNSAALLITLAAMTMLHQLFSWLIGQRIGLEKILVIGEKPREEFSVATLLTNNILYEQEKNEMIFSSHYLNQPVTRTYSELEKIIDYFPFDISYCEPSIEALSSRIRMLILSALQRQLPIPNINAIAEIFSTSDTSLRRRLRGEGETFSGIRSDCQREYAEHLLAHTDQDVQDISEKVGFNDDRSFRRAFKEWNCCTPSQYRDKYRSK